jgi:hypothetical protein
MSRTNSIILENKEIIKGALNHLDLWKAERKLLRLVPEPKDMPTEAWGDYSDSQDAIPYKGPNHFKRIQDQRCIFEA